MSAPILYSYAPSPPCRSVLLLAKCIGIDLEIKETNPLQGDTRDPDFVKRFYPIGLIMLQMNPKHTIPTLDDNGFIVTESRVIMGYLVSAYAKDDSLYPSGAQERATIDQMLYFDMGTLYQRCGECYYPVLFQGQTEVSEEKLEKLQDALEIFEALLEDKEWIAGPTITIADIALVVTVSNIEACGTDISIYPQISAWYDRTKAALEPYGYEEINQSGADQFGEWLKSKLESE